ncbi:NADH:flavin oxidoreductase [Fulvivirga sediminis]|uniref:NADH:flavin oxidoreductase n=1 Tax=Fulvivirga sediminis TaxID=2803949 RepID=A0A937JXZ5_9BACT|nr:NADH:flavin oxidoreductase [Fulvivirga sediminis]MBL3655149.1 NADH:flavin oxidoreductase [Fulvivirga sediminis]
MNLESLFEPFSYRGLSLKNRFVMAPMTRTKSPQGVPTDQVADYYSRRAASDLGLILTEGTVIDRPSSKNHPDIPNFYGEALNSWEKVVQDVHANGGKIAPQIWHVGNTTIPDVTMPDPMEGPETMSVEDIEDAIQKFAESAAAAKRLGFDTLELHGAHGYLIDQFFWPGTNNRTDEYGGDTIAKRNKFAIEVIKAVRAAVGKDMVIILRLSQWKQQDFSVKIAQNPTEMEQWLQPLADAGVDIFHCSQRRFWEPEFEDSDLNFAGWAKKITGQPTITVGSVGLSGDFLGSFAGQGAEKNNNLDELVRRYDRGDFDLIAVGRAILQDFEWVKKVKEGKLDELKEFSPESLGVYY